MYTVRETLHIHRIDSISASLALMALEKSSYEFKAEDYKRQISMLRFIALRGLRAYLQHM